MSMIKVTRFHHGSEATIGALSYRGIFQCFTLEDPHQAEKIYGRTRIQAGAYEVKVRTVGGFHARYGKKYDWHKGMLQIADVPGFEFILVHIGNSAKDTEGCLLVGEQCSIDYLHGGTIQRSAAAYSSLYKTVIDDALSGDLVIRIVDNF